MWSVGVLAALGLSGLIGLSLGLVGGGGSIVTVPVLVYVAGIPTAQAVALSLAIVGTTAAVGAALQARTGNVNWRAAAMFGVTGMIGAVGGAKLTRLVPPPVLMASFAALMIVVGLRMLRGEDEAQEPEKPVCSPLHCGGAGLGLGVLTGFLGVGGGFLIVPALLRFAKLPMRQATATSLAIIAANSASGFLAHRAEAAGYGEVALAFTGAALFGMWVGLALAKRMHPSGLKAAFGALALIVASYLVVMNAGPLFALATGG